MPFRETDRSPFTSTLRPLSHEEIEAEMREIPSLADEYISLLSRDAAEGDDASSSAPMQHEGARPSPCPEDLQTRE